MTTFHRRTLLSGLGSFCAAGVSGIVALPGAAMAQSVMAAPPDAARRAGIVNLHRVDTQRAEVALTFDDGPHPQHTPRLLDILAEARVRATFFVIGTMVRRYPDIVRRMVAEGHELGNHTWTHPTLTQYGDAGVLAEIDRTQDIVFQTVGHYPATFRPPYGAFSPRQSRMLHAARSLPTVNWSVDPQDWRRPGPAVVARRMVEGARPGAIILAHDIHAGTVNAVPAAIDGLQDLGLRCITLSELLGWRRWGPPPVMTRVVARSIRDYTG